MRIAMVSEHASPLAVLGGQDAGGQNVHVAALSQALAARGHEVVVYTRRDRADLPLRQQLSPGVEVVNLLAGPARPIPKDELLPYMPDLADGMANDWALTRPDVVHAHFWMSGLATALATAQLRQPVPWVLTFHALGAVKRRHQGAKDTSPEVRIDVERALLREAAAVVATCRDEVGELLALGADAERLHVVPCGVDLERFGPEGPATAPWSPGVQRLLSLGRLVERKGIESAIDALAELPDAELVIAGGPDAADLASDPDAVRLHRRAVDRGLERRVRLVGRVGPEEAAALLRAADLVLAVPWYEPFGIVPLEAMACGTPVVASAVGGMLDTVRPGVTGAHVPPRDPAAIAEAVRTLLADPDRLHDMGIEGARRVREEYSWSGVAAQTEAAYCRLVTSRVLREPVPVSTLRERKP
jgi:glycosyltransferase involved in cell wall biosynthesis